jgi:TonB family protein
VRPLFANLRQKIAKSACAEILQSYCRVVVALLGADKAKRENKAAIAISVASLLWIVALLVYGFVGTVLPWCVTLGGTAIISLAWFKTRKHYLPFSFLPVKDNKPVSFVESCAATYLVLSLVLGGWILAHWLLKTAAPHVEQQVVDIELVSPADAQDRHMLLSGSAEKPTLAKSKPSEQVNMLAQRPTFSARKVVSEAGAPGVSKVNDGPQEESKSEKKNLLATNVAGAKLVDPIKMAIHEQAESGKQVVSVNGRKDQKASPLELAQVVPLSTFLVPQHQAQAASTAATKSNQLDKQKASAYTSHAKMPAQVENKVFLEEVAPPEMIELVDNKGDTSLNVWQPGGHSTGGAGEKSELMDYLKDLNHRIKSLWSPPGTDPHVAEVLFRIRKTGELAFMKVLHSSGSEDVDESIFQAVTTAAPFKPLPADYPNNYLDVKYTFNYKVDGLAEVSNPIR